MDEQGVLRFGIVGCGGISHAHGKAARNIPTVRFAACCDIREKTTEKWAVRYDRVAVYTDFGVAGERHARQGPVSVLPGVYLGHWSRGDNNADRGRVAVDPAV